MYFQCYNFEELAALHKFPTSLVLSAKGSTHCWISKPIEVMSRSVSTVQGDSGSVLGNNLWPGNIYIMFYFFAVKILQIMFFKCLAFI